MPSSFRNETDFVHIPPDDAFVGLKNVRGLFNTRDRAEHTRKRKIVSSTFAQKVCDCAAAAVLAATSAS